jgi:hypothetical protein
MVSEILTEMHMCNKTTEDKHGLTLNCKQWKGFTLNCKKGLTFNCKLIKHCWLD